MKVVIFFLIVSTAAAQNRNRGNEATDIGVDKFGNVYATGRKVALNVGDCFIVKIDSAGHVLWADNSNCGNGKSKLVISEKGNVYVAGTSCLVKYDPVGVIKWMIPNRGIPSALVVDKFENIYTTGVTREAVAPDYDYNYITTKHNSDGVEQWFAIYSGPGNGLFYDGAIDIAIDASENIYVTGQSYGPNNYDYATIKYNSSGVEQWVKRYDGSGNDDDTPSDLTIDRLDNIYVTGRGYEGSTRYDYSTVKYNAAGLQLWVAKYNGLGDSDDMADAVAVDQAGNVYVIGENIRYPSINSGFSMVKYGSNGTLQWTNANANYFRGERGASLAADDFGSVYAALRSWETYGLAVIKYTPWGIEQWIANYQGKVVANVSPIAITLDRFANTYVAGASGGYYCFSNFIVIKINSKGIRQWIIEYPCSQQVGVTEDFVLPLAFHLSVPFPNPFNPVTTIQFSIPRDELVNLTIYDVNGGEVETILHQKMNSGVHTVSWNGNMQPSGVYFISMNSGEFQQTRKVLLLK